MSSSKPRVVGYQTKVFRYHTGHFVDRASRVRNSRVSNLTSQPIPPHDIYPRECAENTDDAYQQSGASERYNERAFHSDEHFVDDGDNDDNDNDNDQDDDDDVDVEDSENVKEATALRWRMSVCVFALLLLWTTTLELADTIITSTTTVPSFASVYQTCEFSYNEVLVQQRWYEECAINQLQTCAVSHEETLKQSLEELEMKQQHNIDKYVEIQNFQEACSVNILELFGTLETYVSQLQSPNHIVYQSSCPSATREQIEFMLGADTSTTSGHALSRSEEYVQQSQITVSKLAAHSAALGAYNTEYLANKTEHLRSELRVQMTAVSRKHQDLSEDLLFVLHTHLEQLIACVSLMDPPTSTPSPNCDAFPSTLLETFAELRQSSLIAELRMRDFVTSLEDSLHDYSQSVDTAVQHADDFFTTVTRVGGAMDWVDENLVSLLVGTSVNLCNIGPSPSWCSYDSHMWFINPPTPPGDLPPFFVLPTGAELWEPIESGVASALAANEDLIDAVLHQGDLWHTDLLEISAGRFLSFDDYNPPAYADGDDTTPTHNLTDVVSAYADSAEVYLVNLTAHLVELATTLRTNDDLFTENISQFTITDTSSGTDSLLSDHSFSFQSLNILENINLLLLLEQFGDLKQFLLLMDLVFRLFQTVRMIRQFWDKSAVLLPVVDMRSHREESQPWCRGVKCKNWPRVLYMSLSVCGHVWVLVGVLMLALAVIASQITGKAFMCCAVCIIGMRSMCVT